MERLKDESNAENNIFMVQITTENISPWLIINQKYHS